MRVFTVHRPESMLCIQRLANQLRRVKENWLESQRYFVLTSIT